MTIVFIFRLPSFFEPYAYGDEMIYLTLGEGIRQGVTLYSEIHDNKPPLLYLTAALAGSVFWFRAILAVWHIITIYIFWRLIDHLFPKKKIVQITASVVFSLLTTIPLFEGNIANSEIFMIGFTMLGFYLLLKKRSIRNSIFAGILFSIATMFKIPAIFDIPAIIIYLFITSKPNRSNVSSLIKTTLIVSISFLIPITISFIYYFFKGALWDYAIAGYLQNFGYLSSFRPSDATEPFLVKNAPLLLRGFVLTLILVVVFFLRKKLSKQFILATVWLSFTLFAVTLPERPYPHYLIQSVPPISIMIGMLFGISTIEQVLVVFPLTLTFFVPIYFRFWIYQSTPYYQRYVDYFFGKISEDEYMLGFGDNVLRTEKVSEFVSSITRKDERIFVWGDNSSIYAKSKRLPPIKYTVDYHIHDFSSQEAIINQLSENKPVLVLTMPDAKPYPDLDQFVSSYYFMINEIDGVEIWKLSDQ